MSFIFINNMLATLSMCISTATHYNYDHSVALPTQVESHYMFHNVYIVISLAKLCPDSS